MKQRFKHTFILGILFILIANFFVSSYIPVHAANTDVNKDKDRRSIKALRDCMDKSVIDEDDDIDNYSDVFDDTGRKELIVVGFDISKNGVIACTTAVRMGLKAMGLGNSNAEVEKYFIEYITGDEYNAGQTIPNDSGKMLANMGKLRALAQKAYDKTESPDVSLKREQIAPLVNKCFTATSGSGTSYNKDRGDFKVDGLGTFQQKDKLKVGSFSWLKFDKNHNTYKIGDLPLNFVDFNQNGSDGSTDFYPFRSDISETSSYKNNAVIDCHFIAKNKDWIFDKNVKIKDGKAVFTSSTGEEISTGTDNADVGAEADEPSCEVKATNPLAWGICPIVNGLADLTDWILDSFIYPLLEMPVLVVNPGSSIFKVWSGFRMIANIVLVIVFLIMIFGQAIGGGLVDAYTVKKVIPRIVIGAIGINLSIYLSSIMIDITNVVGRGLGALITAPFIEGGGNQYKPGALSGAIVWVVIVLSAFVVVPKLWNRHKTWSAEGKRSLGSLKDIKKSAYAQWTGSVLLWALLFIGIPVAIATISIFVTLILRTGIILLCAVSAPVAIALWILPNTEQYFKKWWSLFTKALLVYPIIVVLFAMGDVLAYAFGGNLLDPNNKFGINGIIAVFAQFLPLFMIGYAFKIAGGILGSIQETISKRGKQAGEFIKGDERDQNSLRNKTKRQLGEKSTRLQAGLARPYMKGEAKGMDRVLGRLASVGNVEQRVSNYNKAAAERRDALRQFGPDDLLYAAGGWEKNGEYYNSKGKKINKNLYKKAKSLYGGSVHDLQANVGYALEKAQTDEDLGMFRHAFLQNAEEMGLTEEEAQGAWQGITYPQKGRFASEKYAKPVKQADGSFEYESSINMQPTAAGTSSEDGRMEMPFIPHRVTEKQQRARLTDLHKTRQSFRLAEVSDADWGSMFARQQELEARVANDPKDTAAQMELLQSYEVFDASSQKLRTLSPDAEDEATASGPTAAAQRIITQAVQDRQYDVQTRSATSTGPQGQAATQGSVESRLVDRGASRTAPVPPRPQGAPVGLGDVDPNDGAAAGVTPAPTPARSEWHDTARY